MFSILSKRLSVAWTSAPTITGFQKQEDFQDQSTPDIQALDCKKPNPIPNEKVLWACFYK